jgi:hypothetical protein
MKENMMKEDMMSSDVEIDEIGDTKMGEAKGTMNFPQERKRVAKKIMSQQMFKGLPKKWKGRGDYFFEAQDDGSLKITGGDAAKSLTGGKSTVITDDSKIKEILQKARGGDILEENVSYKMSEEAGPSFESRGGGSAGLEYLNETESDAVMPSLDPNLSEVDNPMKFAKARKTSKEILSEIPKVEAQAFQEAMSKSPQMKFLKEKVDELSGMGNSEGAAMLAQMLVDQFEKDKAKFQKNEGMRETIMDM